MRDASSKEGREGGTCLRSLAAQALLLQYLKLDVLSSLISLVLLYQGVRTSECINM